MKSNNSKRYVLGLTQDCDQLLKTLVDRIILICPLYSVVVHFTEHYDNCLVNQALNAFIRSNIQEYSTLIAQLETVHVQNELTLQKMWYFLQPFFNNFEILRTVCGKIKQGVCIGGAVLSILHEKTMSCTGNLRAYEFCLKMTQAACEPYFRILKYWLDTGIIRDIYKEFFIEGNNELQFETEEGDFYWENCFQIIPSKIPMFLQRFAEKILLTGKYISVIRQSTKKEIEFSEHARFVYMGEERNFFERIEVSYNFVSKLFLDLMLDDYQLLDHLHSIKHYFLMDKSDYIEEFIELADSELRKEINNLLPARLEYLLEMAVRTSVISNEQHADNLKIEIVNESILHQFTKILSYGSGEELGEDDEMLDDFSEIKGYEAVALQYKVGWPLNIILNQKNLKCYQMLFQYLFFCKNIEKQLTNIRRDINFQMRGLCRKQTRTYTEFVSTLQKMLNFVQNLESYMFAEVIEPNFHSFSQKVKNKKVNSIDEMINEHNRFVEVILNSCMMNEKYAFRYVAKLLQLCVDFISLSQVGWILFL